MSDPRGRRGRIPESLTPLQRRRRRRPHRSKGPLELHDPCRRAIAAGETPCSTCAWLAGLEAPYVDDHVDRKDDEG